MATALWIAHAKLSDPEAYGEYARRATEVLKAHGGVILARGGACEQLEGPERPRNVVVRFPSLQAAHDCYYSEDYQAALKFAEGAAERELSIVEELE